MAFYVINILFSLIIFIYLQTNFDSDIIVADVIFGEEFNIEYLVYPLLLLIISEIFRLGLKMQKEQELTV